MDISSGHRSSFVSNNHHRPIGHLPVSHMIRLHDLITVLQQQSQTHGNIECDISVLDPKTKADLNSSGVPSFELHEDPKFGNWLAIEWKHGDDVP